MSLEPRLNPPSDRAGGESLSDGPASRGPARGLRNRLEGRVVARRDLDVSTLAAMFALLDDHFAGADRRIFDADLAEKNRVILLEDMDGILRGFSTMLLYETAAGGTPVSVVYSGDTIVEREYWGSPALARTWIDVVRQVTPADGHDLYWFLLTSGYRTYRFLPVFFRTFYPRYDQPAQSSTAALLDAIALERFGNRYDPASGIVRFERPQILMDDLRELPGGRALDPHIAYFLQRNPGHVRGDELACITRIYDDNLTAAGRRLARIRPER
jgi:hypothetical protein